MLTGVALAPYLGVALKKRRSAAAVRGLQPDAARRHRGVDRDRAPARTAAAAGFRIHFFLNAAPQYLRFAPPAALEWLMPAFRAGFNAAVFPGAARGAFLIRSALSIRRRR
jgi:hypothetical protein